MVGLEVCGFFTDPLEFYILSIQGIIKRIEWKEEKARSGATVTTIFQELSSRNLKCPVIVNGNKLLETKVVDLLNKWMA